MLRREGWTRACGAALGCALALVTASSAAQPTAEQVAKAEAAFDDGATAFRAENYELAASRFEAADAAVPSARVLRMAMRSRLKAGHAARAATLAALALDRHADDTDTAELARTIVAEQEPQLHRLEVRCTPACRLALDARAVPGGAREQAVVFLDPGTVTLGASFEKGADAEPQLIEARAGGRNELRLAPPSKSPSPESSVSSLQSSAGDRRLETEDSHEIEDSHETEDVEEPSWIESPVVFLVGVTATAALGGVTIWSGVDTVNEPGTERVKEVCAGLGSSCPEYQDGRDKQTRTNVLIGATAGVGALTAVLGIFVTEWGGDDASEKAALRVGPGSLEATARF